MEQEKNKEVTKEPSLIFWLIVFIFFIGAAFYFAGFRLERNLHLSFPGAVKLSGVSEGSLLTIDGLNRAKVKKGQNEVAISFIPEGVHTISITRDDLLSWQKTIGVMGGKTTLLFPFLFSKSPEGSVISSADPEYEKIVSMLKGTGKNSAVATSTDGKVTLTSEGKILKARYGGELSSAPAPFCENNDCLPEVIIFTTDNDIRQVGFYKNRSDVAIVAEGNEILAIEIDNLNSQNIDAVYKGKEPQFTASRDNPDNLFISDNGTIMSLKW